MQTASAAHLDHDKLADSRRQEWDAILHEAYSTGSASLYVADCAPDVLVQARSMDYLERGAGDQRRSAEDTVAAGVQLNPTGVVASPAITIFEGTYTNPPDDPFRCPATHTEVRIHPDGQTTQLLLYFPPPTTQRTSSDTS